MESMLNRYVGTLAVEFIKLHNLHWNVEGLAFKVIHEFTEQMYEDRADKFDAVAELLKMKGLQPAGSMKKYVELSVIDEVEDRSWTAEQVLSTLVSDGQKIYDLLLEIREKADAEGDFATVAMMEDHLSARQKELWFLKSMTK